MTHTLRLRSYLAMGVSAIAVAAVAMPAFAQNAAPKAASTGMCPEPQNYPELIGQQTKCSRKSA